MNVRILATLLVAASPVLADSPFTSLHPEAAIPDPDPRIVSGPYSAFIARVQERLLALGFDAGPVNGDFGAKTQAALAQYQLSVAIPASGQLDDETLSNLGIRRGEEWLTRGNQ